MQLAWLTDIHLNFLTAVEAEAFLASVRATPAEAVLVTGDVAEAASLGAWLQQVDDAVQRPVYFVLGNHDYYGGSIAGVRAAMVTLQGIRPRLQYLTATNYVELTPTVGLVGDDGWADARFGDYARSYVMMNDYRLIAELAPHSKESRWHELQRLGDEAAQHIRRVLPQALKRFRDVILATHVPPLREACWHQGRLSDDEWAPHFTCKAMGDAILDIMRDAPENQLTVYCGHTHSPGVCRPLPNVTIHTGGAQYGHPAVELVETP